MLNFKFGTSVSKLLNNIHLVSSVEPWVWQICTIISWASCWLILGNLFIVLLSASLLHLQKLFSPRLVKTDFHNLHRWAMSLGLSDHLLSLFLSVFTNALFQFFKLLWLRTSVITSDFAIVTFIITFSAKKWRFRWHSTQKWAPPASNLHTEHLSSWFVELWWLENSFLL